VRSCKKIVPQLLPLILLLALWAAPAGALHTVLTDNEPCNDAIAPSAPCPSGAPIQMTSVGAGLTIGVGDGFVLDFRNSDFFGIDGLVQGDILVVSTTPLQDPPFLEDPDTVVGLFDSATIDPSDEDQRLCIGDDTFNSDLPPLSGFGSLCRFKIETDGTYFVGITGFDADEILFDDNHSERDTVCDAFRDSEHNTICDAIRDSEHNTIYDAIRDSEHNTVCNAFRDSEYNTLCDAIADAI
jgi:hypothetical protein